MTLTDVCLCEDCRREMWTPAQCLADHRQVQDERAAHAAKVHLHLAQLEARIQCGANPVRDVAMGLLSLARVLHEEGFDEERTPRIHEAMVRMLALAHGLLSLDDWALHRARVEYREE